MDQLDIMADHQATIQVIIYNNRKKKLKINKIFNSGLYGRPPYYGGSLGPGIGAGAYPGSGFGGGSYGPGIGPLPFGSQIPFNSKSGAGIEAEEEPEPKNNKKDKKST